MSAGLKLNLISVEDYLEGELRADVKHEYLGGVVYAMVGGNNAHNMIATNCLGLLFGKLQDQNCRPFNSDTKVRLLKPGLRRFYYPDAMGCL